MWNTHFIGHEEEMFLFSKSDHIFDALPALDLTCHTGQRVWKLGEVCEDRENKLNVFEVLTVQDQILLLTRFGFGPHIHNKTLKHQQLLNVTWRNCKEVYQWGFRGWWCRGHEDCSAPSRHWALSWALWCSDSNSCLRPGSNLSGQRPGLPGQLSTEGTGGWRSSLLFGHDPPHTPATSIWSWIGRCKEKKEESGVLLLWRLCMDCWVDCVH